MNDYPSIKQKLARERNWRFCQVKSACTTLRNLLPPELAVEINQLEQVVLDRIDAQWKAKLAEIN